MVPDFLPKFISLATANKILFVGQHILILLKEQQQQQQQRSLDFRSSNSQRFKSNTVWQVRIESSELALQFQQLAMNSLFPVQFLAFETVIQEIHGLVSLSLGDFLYRNKILDHFEVILLTIIKLKHLFWIRCWNNVFFSQKGTFSRLFWMNLFSYFYRHQAMEQKTVTKLFFFPNDGKKW